jgi:hypothetical protein
VTSTLTLLMNAFGIKKIKADKGIKEKAKRKTA